jgi:hypothetical protein
MADDNPQPQRKPFAAWLHEHRGGALHSELGEKLAELSVACLDNEKGGTLTVTIKVKPAKVDGALIFEDEVKVKVPEPDRGGAIWFPDSNGNLSRRDPRQPELPGVRVVGNEETGAA